MSSELDKRHCCCCIHLPDGVMLVGIYGASFHAGLLVIQFTYGPLLTPGIQVDPNAETIVHPLLLAVHSTGVLVNLMLGKCDHLMMPIFTFSFYIFN